MPTRTSPAHLHIWQNRRPNQGPLLSPTLNRSISFSKIFEFNLSLSLTLPPASPSVSLSLRAGLCSPDPPSISSPESLGEADPRGVSPRELRFRVWVGGDLTPAGAPTGRLEPDCPRVFAGFSPSPLDVVAQPEQAASQPERRKYRSPPPDLLWVSSEGSMSSRNWMGFWCVCTLSGPIGIFHFVAAARFLTDLKHGARRMMGCSSIWSKTSKLPLRMKTRALGYVYNHRPILILCPFIRCLVCSFVQSNW